MKLVVSRLTATKSHKTSTWFETALLKGRSCSSWLGFWNVFGGKKTQQKTNKPRVQDIHICREHQESLREAQQGLDQNHTSSHEGVVDWEPYSGDSLIFPVQPLSSRDSQLLLFSKAGWVRKLLTPLFPPCIFISASPNGPESSYNQLSGHLWLLRNGVTQPNYIRKRTSFICSHKLNKPRQEKTQAPEKTHAYIS